jgi:hypothetical protein
MRSAHADRDSSIETESALCMQRAARPKGHFKMTTRFSLLALMLCPILGGCVAEGAEERSAGVEATGRTAQRLTLNNFPDALMTEHMNWHLLTPGTPGARKFPFGSPGSGQDFLQFHRGFVPRALAWYYAQPSPDYDAVAPWYAVPSELKTTANGWSGSLAVLEQRILNNDFTSDDDFGIELEGSIHGWLHGASAQQYGDPNVGNVTTSPLSSYFYKIHGLIDYWWARFQFAKGNSGHKTTGFSPVPAGGCVMDLGAGSGTTWALGCGDDANGDYPLFQLSGAQWQFMAWSAGTHVAVSPEGTPWVIDHAGTVKKWNATTGSLVPVTTPGCATSIGVGARDNVWITGCGGWGDHYIYHLAGDPWGQASWRLMPGRGTNVKVSENGVPWVITSAGAIYRWEPSGWSQTSGCASALAVGQNGTFVLGCEALKWAVDASIWQWSETSQSFAPSNGEAGEVAVAPNGIPWVATQAGITYVGN